jgi:hypothetical protein
MDALIRRKLSDSSVLDSQDFDIVFILLIVVILVIVYLRVYLHTKRRKIPKALSWCFPTSRTNHRFHLTQSFGPNRSFPKSNEPEKKVKLPTDLRSNETKQRIDGI